MYQNLHLEQIITKKLCFLPKNAILIENKMRLLRQNRRFFDVFQTEAGKIFFQRNCVLNILIQQKIYMIIYLYSRL